MRNKEKQSHRRGKNHTDFFAVQRVYSGRPIVTDVQKFLRRAQHQDGAAVSPQQQSSPDENPQNLPDRVTEATAVTVAIIQDITSDQTPELLQKPVSIAEASTESSLKESIIPAIEKAPEAPQQVLTDTDILQGLSTLSTIQKVQRTAPTTLFNTEFSSAEVILENMSRFSILLYRGGRKITSLSGLYDRLKRDNKIELSKSDFYLFLDQQRIFILIYDPRVKLPSIMGALERGLKKKVSPPSRFPLTPPA